MEEIPDDIRKAATEALRDVCGLLGSDMQWDAISPIASAIMDERERCAKIVENAIIDGPSEVAGGTPDAWLGFDEGQTAARSHLAAAIRALSSSTRGE